MEKTTRFSSKFVLIVTVLALASFVGQITEIKTITSICFAMSFVVVLGAYVWDCLILKKVSPIMLVTLGLIVIAASNSYLRGVADIKQAIIVVSVVVCFEMATRVSISKKTKNIIIGMFAVTSALTLYLYYFGGLDKTYLGEDLTVSSDAITLNFSNPNEAALWLTALFVVVFLGGLAVKNIFAKVGLIGLSFMLFPIIDVTQSRNALIACVLCVIVGFIFWITKIKELKSWVIAAFVILPLIVFLFNMYVVIPNLDSFEELFSFLLSEGKTLTSRNKVWTEAIEDFSNWWIIGDYSYYYNYQMHNSVLTLLCTYGIPSTLFILYFVYKDTIAMNKTKGIMSAFAICVILFTGCFEASVFVGVAGLYLIVLIAPCVLENENADEKMIKEG